MKAAAKTLLQAIQKARQTQTPLQSQAREVDLEQAYQIQAQNFAGRVLKGYKLGLVSPAKQKQMGLGQPVYGRISPEMLLEGPVRLGNFIQPRLEPELAVVLNDDLPAGASPGQAMRAAGGFFLGLDILDSVWEGYRFSAVEVVADNTSGGAFLLGHRQMAAPPGGLLRLWLDGQPLGEGPVEALGNPYERLVWLAGAVGGLQAGQVVFLGSPAAAVPARAGVVEVACGTDVLTARLD